MPWWPAVPTTARMLAKGAAPRSERKLTIEGVGTKFAPGGVVVGRGLGVVQEDEGTVAEFGVAFAEPAAVAVFRGARRKMASSAPSLRIKTPFSG